MKPTHSVPAEISTAAPSRQRKHSKHRTARIALLCVLGAFAASIVLAAAFIMRQATIDQARRADAIIVFGAAEYAGRPSPVYRARLDHAYDLFQRGVAPMVITTGGAGDDPKFTEGGVGRDYLSHRGIPDRCLIAETQSADTAESAQRVSAILHANHMHAVVAVSDAYHIFRIQRLMRRHGIIAYGSPRPGSVPHTAGAKISASLRESASYLFWRLYPTSLPH
jgi:uncharacterized SAM-binding protein YcdF (DUF218 family)